VNKLIDLNIAEQELKDAQSRFDVNEAHILKVDNELTLLGHIEKNLLDNISILKSRQIITVALEYKKAREDLGKVYNNLTMLRLNRNGLEHSLRMAKKILDGCRERYAITLQNQGSRVIEVDFGRNNNDRQNGNPT